MLNLKMAYQRCFYKNLKFIVPKKKKIYIYSISILTQHIPPLIFMLHIKKKLITILITNNNGYSPFYIFGCFGHVANFMRNVSCPPQLLWSFFILFIMTPFSPLIMWIKLEGKPVREENTNGLTVLYKKKIPKQLTLDLQLHFLL